ncbi:flagellar biosynthetic protein FliR [Ectobacillus polymachus]|uniref:flagellar biosynthetic protein FliR n=1 Tax=Ectobacillus polymachus TaxID=1508806 RepID=UPI003A8C2EFB
MDLISYIPLFLLVFVRISAFFVAAPIWNSQQIPSQVKWGFSFCIAFITVGVIQPTQPLAWNSTYFLLVFKELAVGLSLGFASSLLLYAVELAGSFIDLQSGFTMSSLFDQKRGIQEPLTGKFYYIITMIFFLLSDGHHILIKGIIQSYQWIAVDAWLPDSYSSNVVQVLLGIVDHMFWISLLIAAPLVGTLFIVDVVLGIIARTVPQMNLFVVGVPIKLFVYYVMLYASIPVFLYILSQLVQTMISSIEQMLRILGG